MFENKGDTLAEFSYFGILILIFWCSTSTVIKFVNSPALQSFYNIWVENRFLAVTVEFNLKLNLVILVPEILNISVITELLTHDKIYVKNITVTQNAKGILPGEFISSMPALS